MGPWRETYRGAASPWECDVTEHFTVAFYFDRIAIAEAALAVELGLADRLRRGGFVRRYDVRLVRELHAGSAFHIDSAAIGADDGLRIGHRVVEAAAGGVVTWFDVHWDGVSVVLPSGQIAAWDGPEFEPRADPPSAVATFPTAAGRVQTADLDESGRMGLAGIMHKFSHSAVQTISAIGLTADYVVTDRRSFSTFELRLRIARPLRLGDRYRVRTGIVHLGNSSLRFLHVMTDPITGEEIARAGQFGVQLDLDARRPAPLRPELRERARRLASPAT